MNAEDVLKYGHLTVVRAVEGFTDHEWNTPNVCGVWSVKEIIAHLASFEHLLVESLELLLDGGPTPTLDTMIREGGQGFNDHEVGRRRDRSVEEIWAEYEETFNLVASRLTKIPIEKRRRIGIFAWYGEPYDLEDIVAYSFYGHKREHCSQIDVFRDRLVRGAAGEQL